MTDKPVWPTQANMPAFYGAPGSNLIRVAPPFKMTYGGNPVHSFAVNRHCAESLLRVLNRIWELAGKNQSIVDAWGATVFGGCFNNRSMVGRNRPSCHAFGAAIDLDPARNPYTHDIHDRHFTSDCATVRAFKEEGWVWGGDWHGPYDAMHFQAARVR